LLQKTEKLRVCWPGQPGHPDGTVGTGTGPAWPSFGVLEVPGSTQLCREEPGHPPHPAATHAGEGSGCGSRCSRWFLRQKLAGGLGKGSAGRQAYWWGVCGGKETVPWGSML